MRRLIGEALKYLGGGLVVYATFAACSEPEAPSPFRTAQPMGDPMPEAMAQTPAPLLMSGSATVDCVEGQTESGVSLFFATTQVSGLTPRRLVSAFAISEESSATSGSRGALLNPPLYISGNQLQALCSGPETVTIYWHMLG